MPLSKPNKKQAEALDTTASGATVVPLKRAAQAAPGGIVAGLFAVHSRRIQRFLQHRLHHQEDAQDAAQEVFLKLWKREREGALREEAGAYMHSAAHTVVIDMQRHRKSHACGHA